MATYTKETALYDTGAIANDIANAGTKATSYITRVDATNGIRVHDINESTDFVQVNSSAISMYRGGTAAANEKVRIEDDEIRVGATTTGHAILNDNGMDVYTGEDLVAHYGDYARIGKDGEANTLISPDEVSISAGNGINAFKVTPDGNTQTVDVAEMINKTIKPSKSITRTHPSTPSTGAQLRYRVRGTGWHTITLVKGTSSATTTVAISNRFRFEYSATASAITIKNTGSENIQLVSVTWTEERTAPLIEASGVLTFGRFPTIDNSTILAIGNGTESASSNALAVTSNGDLLIRGNQLNPFDVRSRIVWQPIGSTYPSQLVARQFGNFVFVSYKIGGVSLSASSTTAILSLYEDVRPANEAIVTANITDSNYATVGTGLVRFETGGWVYLVAPKSLSQTSGLYVMFTALYLI